MGKNNLLQNKSNQDMEYRGKVTMVAVLTIVLFGLIIGGLIKVIIDEKKLEEQKNSVTIGSSQTTPDTGGESGQTGGQTTTQTPLPNEVQQATPIPTPIPAPKVAIDAGHGGELDFGSVRGSLAEKDANLAIALRLQKLLEDMGYEVVLIRSDDSAVENEKRPRMAIESGADIYVSIHQNSLDVDNDATRGCEVWYCELREDRSDVLSQYVVDALSAETGTRNRGIKVANNWTVLKHSEMPACLVECGFMSSETERNNIFTPEYQQKIAQGIANGIAQFLPIGE